MGNTMYEIFTLECMQTYLMFYVHVEWSKVYIDGLFRFLGLNGG